MLESEAVVETQAFPDLQFPICRPLIHTQHKPSLEREGASSMSNALHQNEGWGLGIRLGVALSPPWTSSPRPFCIDSVYLQAQV